MRITNGKIIYSVSEINAKIRAHLENLTFWIEGEVSSFKGLNHHYRYLYFDLKDTQTTYKLPCIVEPSLYLSYEEPITDGQRIIVLGNLTLWEKEAKYQLYVHAIEQYGEGILLRELEALKKKLAAKDYFDIQYKKELPEFPTQVAVITSKISDAWHDFKKHSVIRFPIIKITLFDVKVQGIEAPKQIATAIKLADKKKYDAIILIRGGGSPEDLSAFNEEKVAEAIFVAKTPIVAGVGHEKDITIAQLVADIAASTPTDAAKILTHNFETLEERLTNNLYRTKSLINYYYAHSSQQLDLIYLRLNLTKNTYQQIPQQLENFKGRLTLGENSLIVAENQQIKSLKQQLVNYWNLREATTGNLLKNYHEKLSLLAPQNILQRGYSLVFNQAGNLLKDASFVDIGSRVKVKLAHGELTSKVLSKKLTNDQRYQLHQSLKET